MGDIIAVFGYLADDNPIAGDGPLCILFARLR